MDPLFCRRADHLRGGRGAAVFAADLAPCGCGHIGALSPDGCERVCGGDGFVPADLWGDLRRRAAALAEGAAAVSAQYDPAVHRGRRVHDRHGLSDSG